MTIDLTFMARRSYVDRENIGWGTQYNVENECDLCDRTDVHHGQVIEYGMVYSFLGKEVLREPHGRFTACLQCKDPISYEMGDFVPEEVEIT